MDDPYTSYWRNIIGMVSPILGLLVSNLDRIEQYLRLLSLLVGIGVGLLSGVLALLSILRKVRAQPEEEQSESE